jgi:hypothetical protein
MDRNERKAVLVMPDVGLKEGAYDRLREEFQNSLVTTLKGAGADMSAVVVVVVVVVVF